MSGCAVCVASLRPAAASARSALAGACVALVAVAAAHAEALSEAALPAPAAQSLFVRFEQARAGDAQWLADAIYLRANDEAGHLRGEVYALVGHGYRALREALSEPRNWCDLLILHPNVKYCRAARFGEAGNLDLGLGRKVEERLEDLHMLRFGFRIESASDQYLEVTMHAPSGPIGTSDYRIALQATALDGRRSILYLSYAYSYGQLARWALEAYLASFGSEKVGFTVVGMNERGEPVYAGGARGLIERNTMRYYLAIDAYLGARSLPESERMARSLRDWFDATERYPLQLRELERDAYLQMKESELERQRAEWVQPELFFGP